jgi:hypothetical protein
MGLPAERPAESTCTCVPLQNQALLRLFEAYGDAREFNQELWQFALQLPALRAENIPDRILRRLVAQGLVAHALETTRSDDCKRTMREVGHLEFGERSCFALTARGVAVAMALVSVKDRTPVEEPIAQLPAFVSCEDGRRELRLGDAVVKVFRWPARNQELVLTAFQEQDWTRRILNPIPPRAGVDCWLRLHNTVLRLNAGQRRRVLRFHGDGSGEGISWEPVSGSAYGAHTG